MKTLPPKLTPPRRVIVTRDLRSFKAPPLATQAPRLSGERLFILGVVALLLLAAVAVRLVFLQHLRYQDFVLQSQDNRLRIIPVPAHRGVIFDRKGRVLATDRRSYTVSLYPMKLQPAQIKVVARQLGVLLSMPAAAIEERVRRAGIDSPYPVRLKHNITEAELAAVMENSWELPGVSVDPDVSRLYPRRDLLSHVLGYTGEVTEAELAAADGGLKPGDLVGKTGIEKSYDRLLRGQPGGQFVEVDARGRPRRIIQRTLPQRGKDLVLTIDADIQAAAARALAGRRGAIVVLAPFSGEVLAMASKPDYDPNLFSRPIRPEDWRAVQARDHPFMNRAVTAYPPGSIFKIVTTAAAMDGGHVSESTIFHSTGSYKVGNRVFNDHGAYGLVNIIDALVHSVDTVYYELAVKMGRKPIDRYAALFDLGQATGIDLPGESPGTIPSRAWKKRHFREDWYTGDTVNMSIGQGYVQVTPLQAASMVATVANGGRVLRPHLVKRITGLDGKPLKQVAPELVHRVPFLPETLHTLRLGLRLVMTRGTATRANSPRITMAGKTGTAEDPPRRKPHAWFVCYAPIEKPRYAVAVFLEQGDQGGRNAAPLARQVLEEILVTAERPAPGESPAADRRAGANRFGGEGQR